MQMDEAMQDHRGLILEIFIWPSFANSFIIRVDTVIISTKLNAEVYMSEN